MQIRIKTIKRGKLKGQFRFEIVADNGELIDPRQAYNDRRDVMRAVELLQSLGDAEVVVIED